MIELPRHVAIVMDGNGRWARRRHLPRAAGHRAGVGATRKIVEVCVERGLCALTLFAFSSENWRRPRTEVSLLMELFVSTLQREVGTLHKNNVRVRFIGGRDTIAANLLHHLEHSEQLTADNSGLQLNIALNYGGHWDIAQAARRLAEKVESGALRAADVSPQLLADEISLAGLPAPDLFIRTGGEQRISNFLLWQLAYSELYFTDKLWPDFDRSDLETAFAWFAGRQRRYGRTGEQVEQKENNV